MSELTSALELSLLLYFRKIERRGWIALREMFPVKKKKKKNRLDVDGERYNNNVKKFSQGRKYLENYAFYGSCFLIIPHPVHKIEHFCEKIVATLRSS